CVFWGPFRAGALPRVYGPRVRRVGQAIIVEAAHDGYRRLADPTRHQRAFLWWPGRGLVVIDRLFCERPQQVSSRLCFASGVLDATAARAGTLVVTAIGRGGVPVREARQYSPELGLREPTAGLLDRRVVAPGEPFGWSLLRAGVRVELRAPDALALCEHAADPVLVKLSSPLTARAEWR
ncbi:MAG TPA: heparinase II/III family protein, partial [Solirubrobacteraceae bacterium]|nr:heparinase II/III family protein [Solirubrobacteraceae bacterium]